MSNLKYNDGRALDPVSVPERELVGFVNAVNGLLGKEQSQFLTEIWLDELTSFDTMPEPTSPAWHLVTVAAWTRLARRIIDIPLQIPLRGA